MIPWAAEGRKHIHEFRPAVRNSNAAQQQAGGHLRRRRGRSHLRRRFGRSLVASRFRPAVPLPEKYLRQQIDNRATAEREARRDSRRAWMRILGEIVFWTLLGLGGFGLAFHTFDYDLGMVYWWAGSVVWVAGVTAAVFSAHRRGEARGDW
jgi:hypothetical protein